MDAQSLRSPWVPSDAAGLLESFRQGLLEERNWCELKSELADGAKANAELARDLASLAVDGGTMIIGLDERQPDNPGHPGRLHGLAERIEQVAHTKVDPPLFVECTPVPVGDGSGLGYMVIHVPASQYAPHQVEGVYFGRGDKTKRRLGDAEVERLFQRREVWNRPIEEELSRFTAARGVDSAFLRAGEVRLVIIAKPIAGRASIATPLLGGAAVASGVEELLQRVSTDAVLHADFRALSGANGPSLIPTIPNLDRFSRTSIGVQRSAGDPDHPITLDINEDGSTWFHWPNLGLPNRSGHDAAGRPVNYVGVPIDLIAVTVREFLVLLAAVAAALDYRSAWGLAVRVDGLAGSGPIANVAGPRGARVHLKPAGYDSASYVETARASTSEIVADPGAVAARLLSRLARGMSVSDYLEPLLSSRSHEPEAD